MMTTTDRPRLLPWAARQQEATDELDFSLLAIAHGRHRRATWWWGSRSVGRDHGAFCYLCSALVAFWPADRAMPAITRAEVMRHRSWHLNRPPQG